MLVCPIAASAAEDHRGDRDQDDQLLPRSQQMAERRRHDAHQQRHRRDLRRGGEERGDRRRRALIDVGRPHVERHGRDLEEQAGKNEHHADDQPGRCRRRRGQQLGELREIHRAGEAVDQRDAIQQQARGERAEDEILQPGLGRAQLVAREGGQHVERQRLQFEPEIQRHHVGRRDHQHHADDGEQHQHGEFETRQSLLRL